MSDAIPTPAEYGARFAGFIFAFVEAARGHAPARGAGLVDGEDARKVLLEAARSAWDDTLVRERRAESKAEREARLVP
jgi:hypothetical protein